MLTIALALLAAMANAVSSVLQRKANLRELTSDRHGPAALVHLLYQPLWLGGLGAVIVGFLLQASALDTGELAEVQPLLALELPMTLLLGSWALRRPMPRRAWADIGVMTAGTALFLFALHPSARSGGLPSGEAWAWSAGIIGAVVAGLALTAALTRGPARAVALGVAAGISFALTAAFMTGALAPGLTWGLFGRWQTYLVAIMGVTAMVLLQEGYRSGSLVVVQPGVTLVDPVVAVALGVMLFGERVHTGGWIVAQVAGALAVAWGVVHLTRSPVAHLVEPS